MLRTTTANILKVCKFYYKTSVVGGNIAKNFRGNTFTRTLQKARHIDVASHRPSIYW